MIYSLKGNVSVVGDNTIVVDTGAVAFECNCSKNTIYQLGSKQGEQVVLTYMQVREDDISLYGFYDATEKALFEKLLLVSGIGPKMAISILSCGTPEMLAGAIAEGNVKLLSGIKGLGKKTAERICLELKDKVDATFSGGGTQVGLTIKTEASDDAITALVSLGLTKNDATKLVNLYATNDMTTQDIVTICLKNMGRS
ncbi:MAG: Holliday junction branch migration protein RuvA [Clostridia bacterium]|nr:Holliday junction branch migration protein RuvA [Clostridia bacterium]